MHSGWVKYLALRSLYDLLFCSFAEWCSMIMWHIYYIVAARPGCDVQVRLALHVRLYYH